MFELGVYLLGACAVGYLNIAWFCSTLPVHVCKALGVKQEMWTYEDWQTFAFNELPHFWGTLLTCSICLPMWIGFVISWPAMLIADLPLWAVPAFSLSWPIFGTFAVAAYERLTDVSS